MSTGKVYHCNSKRLIGCVKSMQRSSKHLTCNCKFPAVTSILFDAVKKFSQNTNIYMITKKYNIFFIYKKYIKKCHKKLTFTSPNLSSFCNDVCWGTLSWFTHQTEANILSHDTQLQVTVYATLFHPVFMLSTFITTLSVSIYYCKIIEIFSNLACFWQVIVKLTKENCLLFGDPVREGGSDQWSSAKRSDKKKKRKKQWGLKSISESAVTVLKPC